MRMKQECVLNVTIKGLCRKMEAETQVKKTYQITAESCKKMTKTYKNDKWKHESQIPPQRRELNNNIVDTHTMSLSLQMIEYTRGHYPVFQCYWSSDCLYWHPHPVPSSLRCYGLWHH